MKKIAALVLTFSGIFSGFSQTISDKIIADSLMNPVFNKTMKADTISKTKTFVKISPNPSKNKIELQVGGFDPGFIQIQFLDARGKQVRNEKRMLFSGNEFLMLMFSLPPGIYLLVVKQNSKIERRKLLIE